ncbi:MAG: hypothetical protein HY554_05110 [Elusimicrobia bacterium]|nr:hypothetical protein [Elusimicrobiota bacterium]
MGYELRALIAAPRELGAVAAGLSGARVADLTEALGLLPVTRALEARLTPAERVPAFESLRLESRLAALALEASRSGPIAYAEAKHSSGRDFQAAVVWRGGNLLGAPRADRAAWDPREPGMTERPVNAALRALGVERAGYGDEWDAVGLARHARTEDW